ncbi:MAG: tetratricopeptide repeat protein [Treponema sp.]|nr:tetratricopeptide repeat protein [Treponema sp.]
MRQDSLYDRKVVKRDGKFLKRLILVFVCAVVLSVLIFFSYIFINSKINSGTSLFDLKAKWREYNYKDVYDISSAILYERPCNYTALVFHGYSAFFLSLSENDTIQAQNYIEESITSLRQALISTTSEDDKIPQIEYMLGKAYFYKDYLSAYHYYADLSVKYLLSSINKGYKANDTAELLGLNYAALGMSMESISSFSEAIVDRNSDTLLLAIAEQYINAKQYETAEKYLHRISEDCKNEKIVLRSQYLLGQIYLEQNLFDNAAKEFNKIIESLDGAENSADAYYGLGLVYEKQGDLVKARSEWRKVLRIQSNHQGAVSALKRISDLKN